VQVAECINWPRHCHPKDTGARAHVYARQRQGYRVEKEQEAAAKLQLAATAAAAVTAVTPNAAQTTAARPKGRNSIKDYFSLAPARKTNEPNNSTVTSAAAATTTVDKKPRVATDAEYSHCFTRCSMWSCKPDTTLYSVETRMRKMPDEKYGSTPVSTIANVGSLMSDKAKILRQEFDALF
jgi:hypothetical protein